MTEDEIITRLVELHDHIQAPATPPRLDAVRGERLVRRRRTASVLAAAAVVVLTAGIVQAAVSDGRQTQQPAPQPSPSPTEPPSRGVEWTPERIRAEGSPGDPQGAIPTTESGLATRLYQVCDGPRCDYLDDSPEDLHVAIEVTQAERSAVFDLHFTPQPWVRAFDESTVLVQDAEWGPPHGPARFRLLRADGTVVGLQVLDDPVSPRPGPDVVAIEDWNALIAGSEEPYLVDDRAGTLRPLRVPQGVRYWGPNVEEYLWGISDDCRVYWAANGTFEEHRLDCADQPVFTFLEEFPPGWLRPGRMVAVEQADPASATFVHVSLDSGATWQRIPLGQDEAVADVLQRLG